MQKQFQHNNNNLSKNIEFFTSEIEKLGLKELFIESNSAIHCCVISGNEKVKAISKKLKEKGFDVKAIVSPTVPENKERLRFCLHAYNSTKEITDVLKNLAIFVKE
jgi:8-amino-7-oxononanoate synthase